MQMRDQVDSDLTLFLYSAIEFIERAISGNQESGLQSSKILIHCYKVKYISLIDIENRGTLDLPLLLSAT